MKYAIISDIHGNLPALNEVIEDARKNGAENYIFVGDYCLSNPYPNECITRIRVLESKYIVQGNEEKYLENLMGKDQAAWTDGQMQISYWCYRNVSPENLDFILSCPKHLEFRCNGVDLHVAHSSEAFIGDCEHREWGTAKVAERYNGRTITKDVFDKDIHSYFEGDKQFQAQLDELVEGIYIFGHSHIQWNYVSKDGKKFFVNPGSCGLPLDCVKGIPYTLLDITSSGEVIVEERRVPFDIEKHIYSLIQSKQYEEANVWSKVIMKELRTGREHMTFFLQFVQKYAEGIGDERRPFAVDTWEKAFQLWEEGLE